MKNRERACCGTPFFERLMDVTQLQQAQEYLEREPLWNMDLLEPLRRGMLRVEAASPRGVLVYNGPGELHMLACVTREEAEDLCAGVEEMELATAHSLESAAFLQERYGFAKCQPCCQGAYLKKEPLPVPGPWEVRQLGREFLPVVVGHYHSYPNPKYLGERLDAGVMHGAFEGEELLGFIGMHSEGSVGLLEVLPAHRRRGVASALLAYMTNWCLERGWTPFSQIYEGNTASEGLHQKLRWELSRQQLFWVMDD